MRLLILALMVAVLAAVMPVSPALAAQQPRTWYGMHVWSDGEVVYVKCTAGRCEVSTAEEFEHAQQRLMRGDTSVGVTFVESSGPRGQGNAYAFDDDGTVQGRWFNWVPPDQ